MALKRSDESGKNASDSPRRKSGVKSAGASKSKGAVSSRKPAKKTSKKASKTPRSTVRKTGSKADQADRARHAPPHVEAWRIRFKLAGWECRVTAPPVTDWQDDPRDMGHDVCLTMGEHEAYRLIGGAS